MLHAPDAFVEVGGGPGGELLRESADIGPFARAGLSVHLSGGGAHGGESFGSEEGGDHDEAVLLEAVEEGVGGVGCGRHFEDGEGVLVVIVVIIVLLVGFGLVAVVE